MHLIQLHLASRGLERMHAYKIKDFAVVNDDNGKRFLKLVKGGETKNHKTDDQAVEETGGKIPFEPNDIGLSPAQYIMEYIRKLGPDCIYLMCRPKRTSKDFHLEKNPDVW